MNKNKIYVVSMYRFGSKEKHSYVHGVYIKKHMAIESGKAEQCYRGGNKYYPEVLELNLNGIKGSKTIIALPT